MQETEGTAGSVPGWEDPRRRKWQPAPGFLPGESHRRRSLGGCTPRGLQRSDTSERLGMPTPAPPSLGSGQVPGGHQSRAKRKPAAPLGLPAPSLPSFSLLPSLPSGAFSLSCYCSSPVSISPSKPHLWCPRLSLQEAIKNLQGSLSEHISSDPVTSRWTLTPLGRERRPCRNQQKLPAGPVPCFLESPLFKLTSTPLLWQREGRHLLRNRRFSRTCDSNVPMWDSGERVCVCVCVCECVRHCVSCHGGKQSNVKTQVPLVQKGPVELEKQGRRIS